MTHPKYQLAILEEKACRSSFMGRTEADFLRLNETLRKFLERHPALGDRFLALVKRFTQFGESIARVRFGRNAAPSTLRSRLQKAETAEKLWLLEQVDAMVK